MDSFPIFCAGKFIETGNALDVINPYTGKSFARTWLAGNTELDEAINEAVKVQQVLKDLPSYMRYEILVYIKEGLIKLRQEFAELLSLESGKPIRYALGEVDRSIQSFAVAAEESRRLPAEYLGIDWTPAGKGKEGLVKYFPIGIVAGISPFNFPLNLAVHKIAPAIAAGCPIILKPSSSTPLSTLKLSRLIAETDLPPGAVSILPMDRVTGNRMVTDDRISLLSFTGSPAVGWEMKRQAGKKKVVLELGGNAGVIISKGTNMQEAIPKCVTGAFSYSGQVCIHTQRIYVLKELYEEFTDRFVNLATRLKYGNPLEPSTEIAAMIDEPNAVRVEARVNEALKEGANLLTGNIREGSFYTPTVLTGTQPDMKVCSEEIFGPVVIIEQIENIKEAVERINESRFGLQAGIFTDSIDEMNYAFNHLEVGGVIINDVPTFRVDHMPYGGVKDSGQGREGIRYAMLDMLEPRLLVKNC
jgi:acyl-CoA reductase-like NAD-dependent aldehyde dehydrogenase